MELWNRMFGKKNVASVPVQREAVPHNVPPVAKPQSTEGTGITLESIFTLPPDDALKEQLALFQAHYDRASREDRENMPPPMTLADTSKQTEYIFLSRDGSAIATRRHYDNRIFVVDANSRLTVSSFAPDAMTDPTGRFQLTPMGKELATEAKNRRSVVFLDIESGRPMRQTPEVPANILQFAFSPDGSVLAIAYDRGFLVWNLRDGSAVVDKNLAGTGKNCFLAWSRDSKLFAIVFNNEATVWSTSNWTQVYMWQGPLKANYRYPVMAVDFTSDGALIAGDNLGYLSRIDIRAQSIKRLTEVETTPVWAISAAPSGPIAAVGRGDGSLELWDVSEGRELARASGHADSPAVHKFVQCIQWSPDGRQLCTWGGYDARIWSISLPQTSEDAGGSEKPAQGPLNERPIQTEAETLKAFAKSVRASGASAEQLNVMGVDSNAEKRDPKKAAIYYLAALELKPGTKQYVDNLDSVRRDGTDIDEIRRICGFSATDGLAPSSFSFPTLDTPPRIAEDAKRKGQVLFEQAHNAPFGSHAQLELYLRAVGTDPNMRGAWSEFGMLAAAAGHNDLAGRCNDAVRILDAGRFLNNASDLLGQMPLQTKPTPVAKADSMPGGSKSDQSSRFWRCPKCKGIVKKSDPSPGVSRYDSVVGSITCGGCGASYPRDVIYGGKYDVPEVSVICPHCSASLRGPDELIGKTCPSCKGPLPPRSSQ